MIKRSPGLKHRIKRSAGNLAYVHKEKSYHVGLAEGDSIELEEVLFRVLETPGHTPHHLSYVVIDKSRSDSPLGVFTGDTLFVGI